MGQVESIRPADRPEIDLDLIGPAGRMLFTIEGMWCGSCARALEAALARVPGVTNAGVHFATTSALIRWDPRQCDLRNVDRCVRKLGYRLGAPLPPDEVQRRLDREVRSLTIRIAVAAFFGMWSMAAAAVLYFDAVSDPAVRWWLAAASGLLSVPAIGYSGLPLFRAGWRTAAQRAPGLDTIVVIGVAGALLLSLWHLFHGSSEVYFDTATMLVTLLLVGRLIELTARRRALGAIRALESTIPTIANRQTASGEIERITADQVQEGDVVIVDAGSVIPADGVVVEGSTTVDRSALTGESLPAGVAPGQLVYGATVNLFSRISISVTRTAGEREIDRIGGHVASAIAGRGETQRLADRMAAVMSIAIPLLSASAGLLALFSGASASDALLRSLSTLVIACPCALGIATPIAFIAAASRAARNGILVRDPAAFERLGAARTIIFDKTGTLTVGRPSVASVEPAPGWTADTILKSAAEAEKGIDHPIARAVLASAGEIQTRSSGMRDGRRAWTVDGDKREIVVQADEQAAGAATRLRVSIDGETIGRIAVKDEARPDAIAAVRALRKRGLKVMLATGDSAGPASHLARKVGIYEEEVFAGCSPEQKLNLVRRSPGPVVFVGDGINDGPALAASDCGIAVAEAHAGATALSSIAISREGVGSVVAAIDLARNTRLVMRQNLAFSVAYNVVALTAAAAGTVPPLLAALAMLLSSASVLLNSLRVRM
jgi:P-type Cu+ transporter